MLVTLRPLDTCNKAEQDLAGLESTTADSSTIPVPWKPQLTLKQRKSLQMTLFAAVFLHMLFFHDAKIPMVKSIQFMIPDG